MALGIEVEPVGLAHLDGRTGVEKLAPVLPGCFPVAAGEVFRFLHPPDEGLGVLGELPEGGGDMTRTFGGPPFLPAPLRCAVSMRAPMLWPMS